MIKTLENLRLLVVGAGVNGSVCASGLFKAGLNVTILARGKRFEDILSDGIVIEDPFKHTRTVTKIPAIQHLWPEDCYDFVLVVVRKSQVADLLPVLAQNRSPNIVFMGNNLAGPDELIKILGKERVMLGSVYAAGKRDGGIIRAMVIHSVAAPFGEIDGRITPRLTQLATIFRQAGFKVELSPNIVDFQMTHAAGVALIGKLTMKHGCDLAALAREKGDLRLFIAARREAQQVLRVLGHRVVPWTEAAAGILPAFVQVIGFQALLNSKFGEVGLAWHVSQAPDEMQQLSMELQELVDRAGIPSPAIQKILGPNG